MKIIWYKFQKKYKVTSDKIDEILIDKLKGIYQLDKNGKYRKALDDLISVLKNRKTWV